ncbi:Phospholipase_D-nuclease N-terminal [Nonomuraea maritima]|uniref:Phospholipase_D-nuclease N-terminal n=1 Tax=Nonomuraea maritima TaxID=683260 RepID=A0A1G9Q9A8_9ACTN|nr:PLDc N-terminal domain-containing protein [Nonomuraea maritima]SDM06915.1 Phospholipase_D-nuclease N-terminal [Nonomuraea maritima]
MLLLFQVAALATLALWLFSLFDAIGAPDDRCRVLPKTLWVLVVLFLPLLGSAAWLAWGRPERPRPAPSGTAIPAPADPVEDEEAFLRRLRERAEEQRRNAPKKPPEQDG